MELSINTVRVRSLQIPPRSERLTVRRVPGIFGPCRRSCTAIRRRAGGVAARYDAHGRPSSRSDLIVSQEKFVPANCSARLRMRSAAARACSRSIPPRLGTNRATTLPWRVISISYAGLDTIEKRSQPVPGFKCSHLHWLRSKSTGLSQSIGTFGLGTSCGDAGRCLCVLGTSKMGRETGATCVSVGIAPRSPKARDRGHRCALQLLKEEGAGRLYALRPRGTQKVNLPAKCAAKTLLRDLLAYISGVPETHENHEGSTDIG